MDGLGSGYTIKNDSTFNGFYSIHTLSIDGVPGEDVKEWHNVVKSHTTLHVEVGAIIIKTISKFD